MREQQHRQQSNNLASVIRKSDQSQQTELFPPCLPAPAVFKDVITQQPIPALPPLAYPQPPLSSQLSAYPPSNTIHSPLNSVNTTMDLATSMTTTVSAVSTLRERLQVSFGTSTERTNLISAAFIHRLKQRVQQRREENALNGIRRMNGNGESSGEDEYEFQQGRRVKRRLRGSVGEEHLLIFLKQNVCSFNIMNLFVHQIRGRIILEMRYTGITLINMS